MERKQMAISPNDVNKDAADYAAYFEQTVLRSLAAANAGEPGVPHEEVFRRLRERLIAKMVVDHD